MNKLILVLIGLSMTSCAAMPSLFHAAEDIANDTAVKVEVSREAIQKQTDINLSLDVKNKDPVVTK